MSVFLLQAADILETPIPGWSQEPHVQDEGEDNQAFVSPTASWHRARYPNKRFVADFETEDLTVYRYFRNRRKAERWARQFTANIRHL